MQPEALEGETEGYIRAMVSNGVELQIVQDMSGQNAPPPKFMAM